MKTLNLVLDQNAETTSLKFNVRMMVNAGYVGRNIEAVKAHIEELAKEGVPAPSMVPMVFPVTTRNLTTSSHIEVVGSKTSGEAEYVLLIQDDEIYVGVGSDHTDRQVEQGSIVKSKQVCQNLMSKTVWNYNSIRERWDDLLIKSWVKPLGSDEEILYQEARLGTIISPNDIIELIRSKMTDHQLNGMVIFSGTVPTLTSEMICGHFFRAEIYDSAKDARLSCEYQVEKLEYLGEVDE